MPEFLPSVEATSLLVAPIRLDVLLATIGTGIVVGAAVALLAGLFGDPSTVVVGVAAGVASGVATLFVSGAVVSLRRR